MKDGFDPELFSRESIERAARAFSCEVERRAFLHKAGKWTGGLLLAASLGSIASCARKSSSPATTKPAPGTVPAAPTAVPGQADLGIASGQNPGELARRAVDAVGGMARFVKPGNMVVIKPNASFLDGISGATSTHPEVVSQVIAMCREAGAGRVIVMDHCLPASPEACFRANGIGEAVKRAGAEVIAFGPCEKDHGVDTEIPGGVAMKRAGIYPEVLQADVVITVPKAKHHGSAGLSLGMKNFIGVTADMGNIHNFDLHQSIADLNTLVRPTLSVIDASIILLDRGPGGPGPTRAAGKVIASPDVVAADGYACTLFGMKASDVPHIVYGGRAGLGEIDFNKLKVAEV